MYVSFTSSDLISPFLYIFCTSSILVAPCDLQAIIIILFIQFWKEIKNHNVVYHETLKNNYFESLVLTVFFITHFLIKN